MTPKEEFQELRQDATNLGFGKEVEDALKLFAEWQLEYPLGFWGTTLSREEKFPTNELQSTQLTNALGTSRFTLRVDWKTEISVQQAARINERLPYLGIEEGVWLHDYKTAGKRENDLQELYQNAPQGFCYTSAYNVLHPDNPCRGVVFHRIVNTKKVGFQHAAVRHTARSFALAKTFLQNAEMLKATDMPLGVAQNCRYMFRTCEYLGQCDQGGSDGD